MNKFFENNHFSTIDRGNFEDNEITFGNVWGLCDADVYNKSIKEADKSYNAHKPFFQFIMTTSNHRPFTYPDNKIDIPSKQGRDGGVKYTDYAIGEFIKNAKSKPWFDNTIFVFVADHCASSAGATQLPIEKYKIPLIIYSPHIIQANVVQKMASQIDLAPTLFELLGWNYDSKFYGHNILEDDFDERALISTYQKLGYFTDNILYILEPQKKYEQFSVDKKSTFEYTYKNSDDKKYLNDAISTYQSAFYLYNNNYLKE
jgi:phosphoglycerol transferase MdoB-like AlkP superfamily enzyme